MKKRTFTLMLSLIFILSSFMSITALAASSSQDGLVATLSTDKESYDLDEEIGVSLTVENTNVYEVTNIRTEIILPDGVTVTNGTATQERFTLLAGESSENEIIAVKAESTSTGGTAGGTTDGTIEGDTMDTGDNTNVILWAVLAIGSLIGLIVLVMKNKKNKALHSIAILLSLTILATGLTDMIANASTIDSVSDKSFTISESILIDGEVNQVLAKITYDYVATDDSMDTVTLSFSTGEGSAVKDIAVVRGESLGYYPYTTLENGIFDGWYMDPNGTEAFDCDQVITEGMTIYALFVEDEPEYVEYESTEIILFEQPANFSFTVYSEEKITSSNLANYVQITEIFGSSAATGIEMNYIVTASGNNYIITADGGYEAGSMYEALLLDGTKLVSPAVDGYNLDVITTLTYSIYKEEVETVEYKEDTTFIQVDETLVTITNTNEEFVMGYASITKEDWATILADSSNADINKSELEVGDILVLLNGDEASDYGAVKVISVDCDEEGNYTFIYEGCEYTDLYESMDIYTIEDLSVEDMLADVDTVALAAEIKQSEGIQELTYMLAVALSDSETVAALGDGSEPFTIDLDALAEAEAVMALSSPTLSNTLSDNVYFNNVDANVIIDMQDLIDGLSVNVTIGQMENKNMIDMSYRSDECFGIQVEVQYGVKLDNGVYIQATIDITESFVGSLCSKSASYDDSSADFNYYLLLESETDIGFEILVCSAEFSDDDDADTETDTDSSSGSSFPGGDASADEVPDISDYVDISMEIAGTINEALSDEDLEEENDNIVARMLALLENEGDSIELFNAPIATGSFNVGYVFDINLYFNFVVSVDFAAGLQTEFSYINSQVFGVVGSTRDQTIEFYSYDRRSAGYSFDLYACGYLGLKAGIQSEISVSMAFAKNFGEIGAGFEVGAYLDMYGYLHYNYVKKYFGGATSQSLSGGIYMEIGVYLDAYIFARSNLFSAETEWTFLDKKFKLLSIGNQYVYLELADETYNAELSYGVLTGEYTSLYDIMPTYYGEYLDITSGETVVMALEQGSGFAVDETNEIPYVKTSYMYDAEGNWVPCIKFDEDEFHSCCRYYEKYGVLRSTDYVTDTVYEDYYVGSDGDLYAEDIGLTITYYGQQLSTTKKVYREAGEVDCIWVSDEFDVSSLGKVYTATFQFETKDGELITLGTRTSVAGIVTGYFDIYANASDELKQEYVLDEINYFSYGDAEIYYTWDVDPATHVMTADTTYTVTAPERQSWVGFIYLDSDGVRTYDLIPVTNGEVPEILVEDGSFFTVESVSLYNTSTYTTVNDIDYNNLPAVYTDASVESKKYLFDQTVYTNSGDGNMSKSDALSDVKMYFNYYPDASLVYIVNYDVDEYTVTYVTNSTQVYTEYPSYNEAPRYGAYYAFSAKFYQTFLGWDADGDGEVDYTVDADGNCNLPCTNKDATYTAVYDKGSYKIYIYDYLGNKYEYEVEYLEPLPDEIYDIIEEYALEDGAEMDGGIVKYFEWQFAYDDSKYRYYCDAEMLDYFAGSSTTFYDSITITPYYQTFYKMTFDPGEGSFTSEEEVDAVFDGLGTYYYQDGKLNDDGTITLLVRDDWYLNTSKFYSVLVPPEEDDSYTYEFDYWADENGNKIDTSTVIYATEAMTFVPVYKAVEKAYEVYIYTSIDGYYSPETMTTFEGNYTECQEFITENSTKYEEGEVTEQTDSTITIFTGYKIEDAEYSPGDYTYYIMYMYYETSTRQYNITYTDNIGTGSTSEELDYGSSITKTLSYATEDYTYNFLGWDSDKDGEVDSDLVVTGDMELTAVWEQTCTITFNYRLGGVYKTYTGVVGDPFTEIPDDLPDTTSLTFVGWSEEIPTTFTKNITIDPVFETTCYTVTFELITDGVTTTYEELEVEYNTVMSDIVGDSETAIIPTTPDEATGKVWGGWRIEDIGTSYFDSYKVAEDTTVTGTLTTVYVTYMTGATQYSKTAIAIGETVTVADVVTGYGAWAIDGADLNVDGLTFTMPSSDVTLTALADLEGTFTISDGTNTNVYEYNDTTYDASPTNTTMSGYTFDTTNGILWIKADGITLSGEASDMMIIVDDSVTSLTLQDLTIQNSTKKSYTIPDFEWQEDAEGIDSDPINDMVIYAYGDEFNLTIDGDVEISQTNGTDGTQYIIYYMNLKEGSYEMFDEEAWESGTAYEDCWYEVTGLIADAGEFTMTGINDATFTANSINASDMIMINGDATISDIDFNFTSTGSYAGGIRVKNVAEYDADYNATVLSEGILEMSNCTIGGSIAENSTVICTSGDSTFTDCTFDITSGRVYSDIGEEQMMSFIGATSGSIPGLTAQGLSFELDTDCEIVITGYIWCYDKAITLTGTSADPSDYTFDTASGMMYDADGAEALTEITFTGN